MLNFYDDIQIAPVQNRTDNIFHLFFPLGKITRQAQRQVEIAAIHTANLSADGDTVFVDFCTAKAGHT